MAVFALCLARLRREAGFPTAYQFYHRNGGRRHFQFTYVHYLRMEKGVSLPKAEWVSTLLLSLRLSPGQAATRELFVAYLRDLLKSDAAFDLIVGPLLCRHGGAGQAPAMGWVKAEHTVHMTPDQFRAVAADEAGYWCSEALFNDSGSWSAREIAGKFELDSKACARGLKRLKDAGLAREASKGRYMARQAGKLYTFPGRLRDMAGLLKTVEGYWKRMDKKRGQRALQRVELVRAEEGAMRGYTTVLSDAVDAANLYATHSAGAGTGLYLIESTIRKLTPF